MAIPVGTTSRQLEWLARWVLAGVVTLGALTWWWPGYPSWGTAAMGLLAVLSVWLLWRTVSARRDVPGHPIHLVLAVPCLILAYHFVQRGLTGGADAHRALAGTLDVSMITGFVLLALGVMLSQSLLPRAARHVAVLGVCGGAMMVGPAAAMAWGRTEPAHTALAMLGFAGVGVWLSMLWGAAPPEGAAEPGPTGGRRLPRIACLGVAALAAGALAVVAPLPAVLMAGIVGAALLLAGLLFARRRGLLLAAGGGLAIAVGATLSLVDWLRRALLGVLRQAQQAHWLGSGEEAFRHVSAGDGGVVVLAATVGWLGAAAFVVGLAACIAWLMVRARHGGVDPARVVLWAAAAGAVGAALLAPGGMFIPGVVLAAAFVWGLLPAMLGCKESARSGGYLLAAMVVLGLLAAVSQRGGGLLGWSLAALGGGDALAHAVMGFLLAMLLAWLLGAERPWLGLVGIVLAGLVGGLGEAVQYALGTRTAELRDWMNHGIGCAAAALPYLLCMGARWCESPDVRPSQAEVSEAHPRR